VLNPALGLGSLAQDFAVEFVGESGRFLLDREIHVDNDNAVDMLVAKDRRLEAAAVEPLAHSRHLQSKFAVAEANLGTVKAHVYTHGRHWRAH